MKKLRWPSNAEQSSYMRERQAQNLTRSLSNRNENWMAKKLSSTGYKWRRQAQWGYRVFDFWCHSLGCAVEVDGPEHNKNYDNYRDVYNYSRSGIVVLRVRNMNEDDAMKCLSRIASMDDWKDRRDRMGLNVRGKKDRRKLVNETDWRPIID